jgi:hypothetical protein
VGKPEGKRALRRMRCKWEDNTAASLLKVRTVKAAETAIAKEWLRKHAWCPATAQ